MSLHFSRLIFLSLFLLFRWCRVFRWQTYCQLSNLWNKITYHSSHLRLICSGYLVVVLNSATGWWEGFMSTLSSTRALMQFLELLYFLTVTVIYFSLDASSVGLTYNQHICNRGHSLRVTGQAPRKVRRVTILTRWPFKLQPQMMENS